MEKSKQDLLDTFISELIMDERSPATIEKYRRDVEGFFRFLDENHTRLSKESVLSYKEHLRGRYKLTSANSILAALNSFCRSAGYTDCVVKAFRIQSESFRSQNKELSRDEYIKLIHAAQGKDNQRLVLIMETIASTGIRVSELPFITVEAAKSGQAFVTLKGKSRTVLLPRDLKRKLIQYAEGNKIQEGSIFITRNGKPLDRCNIAHAMKKLGKITGIDSEKLYPHNLRHLFSVCYYQREKDLGHLADILGHSNVNTTRIYTRISSSEQEHTVNSLGLVI